MGGGEKTSLIHPRRCVSDQIDVWRTNSSARAWWASEWNLWRPASPSDDAHEHSWHHVFLSAGQPLLHLLHRGPPLGITGPAGMSQMLRRDQPQCSLTLDHTRTPWILFIHPLTSSTNWGWLQTQTMLLPRPFSPKHPFHWSNVGMKLSQVAVPGLLYHSTATPILSPHASGMTWWGQLEGSENISETRVTCWCWRPEQSQCTSNLLHMWRERWISRLLTFVAQ